MKFVKCCVRSFIDFVIYILGVSLFSISLAAVFFRLIGRHSYLSCFNVAYYGGSVRGHLFSCVNVSAYLKFLRIFSVHLPFFSFPFFHIIQIASLLNYLLNWNAFLSICVDVAYTYHISKWHGWLFVKWKWLLDGCNSSNWCNKCSTLKHGKAFRKKKCWNT